MLVQLALLAVAAPVMCENVKFSGGGAYGAQRET